ncbi:sodium- and chloride-dependent GABA transporter ine [Anabrus simplex]|uniref:sodium- and chloride-dependent GABA transporter ine n=1 Tax=Anabrus simplex TaxID=316456 RepID=UPI0035A33269
MDIVTEEKCAIAPKISVTTASLTSMTSPDNSRPKLSLMMTKNVECDEKAAERNEENRRLLGVSPRKLVIVPASNGVNTKRFSAASENGSAGSDTVTVSVHRGGRSAPIGGGFDLLGCNSRAMASLHSLKLDEAGSQLHTPQPNFWRNSFTYSDAASHVSMRSLASIGMGSTDGRKVTIRRVPTSPGDLLNIATPTDDEVSSSSSGGSYLDILDDNHQYRHPRRQHWSNKAQFVLACIGYSVGLGNVWRFPYLCYKSGGGAFLVPYLLILIICGIPLLYMELAVGQFTRRGPIGALGKMCPLFKGAGLASVVISFLMSTYYNVIIAYTLYYFFSAFKTNIPWNECNNQWNKRCWKPTHSSPVSNVSKLNVSKTPSEEFYENKVLHISSGIEQMGSIRWELAACLIFAWILVYFSIWKSVKSSGKVLYFTATFPYVVIIVFLARALTLEGADLGLRYFFKPKWELLADAKVWVNAAAQNFNSFGIAFGSVISFASYNRFHNQILVDTLAVSIINAFTSILVGIFAFATIGNIATEMGTQVEDVVSDGPGLVFIVYPQAMAKMPATQLWGVLFFFMLLCLSLNSQFAIVEVVVTSIQDGFPNWIRRRLVCHEMLVLVVCIISFLFGLPNIMEGGMYFFQLIDHFAASISIMYLAFFEVIAISWFYGAHRLARNVQEMTGRNPSLYIRFCWWVAAPVLLMAVWVFSLIDYEPPTYNNGAYKYPFWAEALGWGIASLSLVCIPAFAIIVFVKAEGNTLWQKLQNSVKSQIQECIECGHDKCIHFKTSKEELREMNTLIQEKDPQLSPMTPS